MTRTLNGSPETTEVFLITSHQEKGSNGDGNSIIAKEKIKKLDDELLYKKALKSVYEGAKSTNVQFAEFLVLHHDLQEIKKAIEKK